jgi:hypothetical protein
MHFRSTETKLAYDDYRIAFTVAQHQTSPLPLKKESEYEHLLECVLKMKPPAVKILIEASRKPGTTTVHIPTAYMLFVSEFYSRTRRENPTIVMARTMRTSFLRETPTRSSSW